MTVWTKPKPSSSPCSTPKTLASSVLLHEHYPKRRSRPFYGQSGCLVFHPINISYFHSCPLNQIWQAAIDGLSLDIHWNPAGWETRLRINSHKLCPPAMPAQQSPGARFNSLWQVMSTIRNKLISFGGTSIWPSSSHEHPSPVWTLTQVLCLNLRWGFFHWVAQLDSFIIARRPGLGELLN